MSEKGLIIIGIIATILLAVSVIEIYVLYSQSDYVTCDSFGNCAFTTQIRNVTQTISRECYENGKEVNCTAWNGEP
jgi:hypothetical protein